MAASASWVHHGVIGAKSHAIASLLRKISGSTPGKMRIALNIGQPEFVQTRETAVKKGSKKKTAVKLEADAARKRVSD